MSFSNYDDLREAVIRWADNDDVEPRVDDFIALCHTRLNRILRLESMTCFAYVTCTAGDPWVAKPDGYLGMRRLKVEVEAGGRTDAMTLVPFTQIDSTQAANHQGSPRWYAVAGDRFRLAPVPDAGYTLEAIYFERQPTLSPTVPTNDFLVEASDLVLFGSLIAAETYLKDNEMLDVWRAEFSRGLEDLTISTEGEKFPSGDPVMKAV